MSELINILIRTSNRPKSFRRCLDSVRRQQYPNTRLLVSADNTGTQEYVRVCGLEPVMVNKSRNPLHTAPYNLYLNDLISEVKHGWVLILDDDDMLAPHALEILGRQINYLERTDVRLIIARMAWPNGRIIPEDEYWQKMPERKHIGMPCIIFHSSLIPSIRFDGMKAGDYRLAKTLWNTGINIVWMDSVLVRVGNTGLYGKAVDL